MRKKEALRNITRKILFFNILILLFFKQNCKGQVSLEIEKNDSICSAFQDDVRLMNSLRDFVGRKLWPIKSGVILVSIFYDGNLTKFSLSILGDSLRINKVDEFSDLFVFSNYKVLIRTGFDLFSKEIVNNRKKTNLFNAIIKKDYMENSEFENKKIFGSFHYLYSYSCGDYHPIKVVRLRKLLFHCDNWDFFPFYREYNPRIHYKID